MRVSWNNTQTRTVLSQLVASMNICWSHQVTHLSRLLLFTSDMQKNQSHKVFVALQFCDGTYLGMWESVSKLSLCLKMYNVINNNCKKFEFVISLTFSNCSYKYLIFCHQYSSLQSRYGVCANSKQIQGIYLHTGNFIHSWKKDFRLQRKVPSRLLNLKF